MRTTVRLDEDLLVRLKSYAAMKNRSMTSVLEDAVRQLLDRQESETVRQPIDLVTFGSGGPAPEIHLDDPGAWKHVVAEADAEKFERVTHADA